LEKVRGGVGRRERPNILNIVVSRNYLATFDSQQLATQKSSGVIPSGIKEIWP